MKAKPWKRLLRGKAKPAFLRVDWDNLIEEEEEEMDHEEIQPTPKYMEYVWLVTDYVKTHLSFTSELSKFIQPSHFSMIITVIVFAGIYWIISSDKKKEKLE